MNISATLGNQKSRYAIAAGLFFLAAFSIRIFSLDETSLNSDELFSASLALDARDPLAFWDFRWVQLLPQADDSWMTRKSSDLTPVLFDLILLPWAHIFGPSEFTLRLLSVIFGSAAIAAFYLYASKISSQLSAVIYSLVFTVFPAAIATSQNLRAYSLTLLLATIAIGQFSSELTMRSKSRWRPRANHIVILCLLATSHYTGLFLAVLIAGLSIYFKAGTADFWGSLRKYIPIVFSVTPWIILSAPTLLFVASGKFAWTNYSLRDTWETLLPNLVSSVMPGGVATLLLLLSAQFFSSYQSPRELRKLQPPRPESHLASPTNVKFALACIIFTMTTYAVYSAYKSGIWAERYATALIPAVLFFLVVLSEGQRAKIKMAFSGLAVFLFALNGSVTYFSTKIAQSEDYRGAATYISENFTDGDIVALGWYVNEPYYDFYLSRLYNGDVLGTHTVTISSQQDANELCFGNASRVIVFEHMSHNFDAGLESCPYFVSQNSPSFNGVKVKIYKRAVN